MKKQHKVHLLILGLLYGLFFSPYCLYAYQDTTRRTSPENTVEAAAEGPQANAELQMEYRPHVPLSVPKSPLTDSEANLASEARTAIASQPKARPQFSQKNLRQKVPPAPRHQKPAKRKRYFGLAFFKWLDLDWFMVGLVLGIFLLLTLLMGLLLFTASVLSIFELIIFALGFAFAIFSYIFLVSESDGPRAAYEFFVKYGLFSWPGILAIIAGFAGLFGAGGSFLTYLLIGLILGGIAFVISLFLGDSLFLGYEFRKF